METSCYLEIFNAEDSYYNNVIIITSTILTFHCENLNNGRNVSLK